MKILDFDLEGSHFIIEADISPRQEADDDIRCFYRIPILACYITACIEN